MHAAMAIERSTMSETIAISLQTALGNHNPPQCFVALT